MPYKVTISNINSQPFSAKKKKNISQCYNTSREWHFSFSRKRHTCNFMPMTHNLTKCRAGCKKTRYFFV